MNYEQWGELAKRILIDLGLDKGRGVNKAAKLIGTSGSSVVHNSKNDNGDIAEKYRIALLGLWLDRSKFLKACLIHKDNPALLALLVELDSKAESSQEKEKLEQLFNPPSMEQAK